MWRKFLRENLRFGTIYTSSTVFFNYPKNFSDNESVKRIEQSLQRIQNPLEYTLLREQILHYHSDANIKKKVRIQRFKSWLRLT